MSNELIELIEQNVFYYAQHSMEAFVDGEDATLKHFVVDDFTKLLSALEKEMVN